MDKSTRVRLIQRLRDALTPISREDEDLLLETYGVGERPVEDPWGNGPTLTRWLARAADDNLLALAQHLELLDNVPSSSASPGAESEQLFIFASHLSAHRTYLGGVEEELQRYNVRLFVAHDSIPMDALWEKEIVDALNRCHAGAAFLHPTIHESFYCMQEIGWMLGRGIPIARLMFGESPKALLSAQQGKQLKNCSIVETAEAIIDWTLTHPTLVPHVAASLSSALDDSTGYRITDMVWDKLSQVDVLTPEQLRHVIHAAETNSQVFGTGRGSYSGPRYRAVIADRAIGWDSHGQFSDRIETLRTTPTGYIVSPDDFIDES